MAKKRHIRSTSRHLRRAHLCILSLSPRNWKVCLNYWKPNCIKLYYYGQQGSQQALGTTTVTVFLTVRFKPPQSNQPHLVVVFDTLYKNKQYTMNDFGHILQFKPTKAYEERA